MENVVELRNKMPLWNEGLKTFGLHFNGRVYMASVKKIQFLDPRDGITRKQIV